MDAVCAYCHSSTLCRAMQCFRCSSQCAEACGSVLLVWGKERLRPIVLAQSEECLQKIVETMKVLARHADESPKYYLLTGASMKGTAQKLLGLR